MSERTKKIKDQSGKEVEGTVVDVAESTERFSDVRMTDGTLLRIKTVVVEAVRANDQWDNEGNPIYVVRSANILTINEVREEFKRKVQ